MAGRDGPDRAAEDGILDDTGCGEGGADWKNRKVVQETIEAEERAE